MKFRKKPVVIEAWPIFDLIRYAKHEWKSLPQIVQMAYENGDVIFRPEGIDVRTLEGWMFGDVSSHLIAGVQNELYPCKPDIFAATYEEVE